MPDAKVPFNIVIVEHPDFKHGGAFHELGRLLALSLDSLGHPVTVQVNGTEASAVNVVLGYQFAAAPTGVYWVPFQLEQLSERNERLGPRWLPVLSQAPEIWDYDPANIAYLRAHGIHTARHVPIGFHPALRTIPRRAEDIDVLHYGSLSDRRRPVLDALSRHCRVERLFGIYGASRDEFIARSKIVLNMHLYASAVFEQVRVSYLLNNGRCVVSEASPYNPYSEMLVSARYEELVERCLALLADDAERERLAAEGAKRFEAMPMTEILSRAIGNAERALPGVR